MSVPIKESIFAPEPVKSKPKSVPPSAFHTQYIYGDEPKPKSLPTLVDDGKGVSSSSFFQPRPVKASNILSESLFEELAKECNEQQPTTIVPLTTEPARCVKTECLFEAVENKH